MPSSHSSSQNSSAPSTANIAWPLTTYHKGFPCIRLPMNRTVWSQKSNGMNKRSICAAFFFQGINEERLLLIASSLFPPKGETVKSNKGNPFNKVVVRSLTFFPARDETHCFYLLLVTSGESHQISKFIAVATQLRALELIPKADFDKDTKLHTYLGGLLHANGVTDSDLDANELRMREWIGRHLGYQDELWAYAPRVGDSGGEARSSVARADCYAATRMRDAAARWGEEVAASRPRLRGSSGKRPADAAEPRPLRKRAAPPPVMMHAIPAGQLPEDAGHDDLFRSSASPVDTPDPSSEDYIGNWTAPAARQQASGDGAVAVAQWLRTQADASPCGGQVFDIPAVFLDFLRCDHPFNTEERGALTKALCTHYRGTYKGITNGTALSDLPLLDFLTASARMEEALAATIEQVFDLQIPRPMSPAGYDQVRAVCELRFEGSDSICKHFLETYQWLCCHWDKYHTLAFTGMLDRSSTLFVFVVDAVNRCIDTTLKGRGAVSKCIPFADMAALVGQDVSKLAHWIDFLYQTSTLLVQLAQSSHPDESQALREVMDLVAHHRQPPIAFQPQHNSTLSKSVDTAEDVVRRVMHKITTIRNELLSLENINVGQSCYGYQCFDRAMHLVDDLPRAIAADPRGVLSFLQGTKCSFPDNDRDGDDFSGFLAAIRDCSPPSRDTH